jgi:hypothetical protein
MDKDTRDLRVYLGIDAAEVVQRDLTCALNTLVGLRLDHTTTARVESMTRAALYKLLKEGIILDYLNPNVYVTDRSVHVALSFIEPDRGHRRYTEIKLNL